MHSTYIFPVSTPTWVTWELYKKSNWWFIQNHISHQNNEISEKKNYFIWDFGTCISLCFSITRRFIWESADNLWMTIKNYLIIKKRHSKVSACSLGNYKTNVEKLVALLYYWFNISRLDVLFHLKETYWKLLLITNKGLYLGHGPM